jgi:hypothetical protein
MIATTGLRKSTNFIVMMTLILLGVAMLSSMFQKYALKSSVFCCSNMKCDILLRYVRNKQLENITTHKLDRTLYNCLVRYCAHSTSRRIFKGLKQKYCTNLHKYLICFTAGLCEYKSNQRTARLPFSFAIKEIAICYRVDFCFDWNRLSLTVS